MKPTVHDIARLANVSLATVDRVLNRRAGVSEKTRMRVENAVQALGFVRDVAAANLAKGRLYPLIFILPANENSFMRALRQEVEAAMRQQAVERTQISIMDVKAFDGDDLLAALHLALLQKPAGVALVAVDRPDIAAAIEDLRAAGIAVVTLVSDLKSSGRDHFAGIDNMAAGRTAASLLGRFLTDAHGKIAIIAGSMLVSDHRDRFEGFAAVMAEHFPKLALLPVLEAMDHGALVEEKLGQAFDTHGDIRGIYSLGAGNGGLVRELVRALEKGYRRPFVIAHELAGPGREALEKGLFDAVLHQDAGHEVRSAIRVLKAKADGRDVVVAQERIRIDIFLKDNLP